MIVRGMVRRARYAGSLLVWTILTTCAGGVIGLAALSALVHAYGAWLGSGSGPIGGWSFAAAYALLGLVAGGVIGLTLGIGRALSRVLADIRPAFQAESARLAAERGGGLRIGTAELRRRWEHVADEAVARSIGATRIPGAGLLARLVRARLRRGLVDDFLAACAREGVTSVGPAEIGRWIAAEGPSYLFAPAYAQLWIWRIVAVAIVGVAAVAPLLLVMGRGG